MIYATLATNHAAVKQSTSISLTRPLQRGSLTLLHVELRNNVQFSGNSPYLSAARGGGGGGAGGWGGVVCLLLKSETLLS